MTFSQCLGVISVGCTAWLMVRAGSATRRSAETQRLIEAATKRGLQTRDAELKLGAMLGVLGDERQASGDRIGTATGSTREAP
jgi:hypothetical protein